MANPTFNVVPQTGPTPGTSFTILASQGTDTSAIAYEIFEQG